MYVGSNLCFPLVSIVEELFLVVEQFFMSFSRKFKVRTLKKKEKWITTGLQTRGEEQKKITETKRGEKRPQRIRIMKAQTKR